LPGNSGDAAVPTAPGAPAPVTRRRFGKYLTLGGIAAAIAGLWGLRWYLHPHDHHARVIAQTGDIPVGGFLLFQYPTDQNPCFLIRTGQFSYVAFSRICTHAGCPTDYNPENRDIECPCHGGIFSIKDGSVLAGPPPRPLPRIKIAVRGNQIFATGVETS
jgi:arsenite oxidase small subunit